MRPHSLVQLFVRPRGFQTELLLVLENPAGARFRETLLFPTRDPAEAVRRAATHLAYRGEVEDAGRLRVRLECGGRLEDRPDLIDLFRTTLDEQVADDRL